jgi:hypothetical protein
MIREKRISKDVEGNSRGVIRDTIPIFVIGEERV